MTRVRRRIRPLLFENPQKLPLLLFLVPMLSFATLLPPASARAEDATIRPRISAGQLAREVVQHELAAQDRDKSLWKYREFSQEEGKTQILEVVETRDGDIHRVLSVDGKPLSDKARRDEDQRIAKLLANPDLVREKQKSLDHDADEEQKLLKLLPEAFLYDYDGTVGTLVRLKFHPNPKFNPQSRETEVFHHMEGTLLVDPKHDRLAQIQGTLVTEVKFWDGLLGHLDKGGTFLVRQKDVGGGHWEMVELNVQMNGKALFFKTIAVREKEVYSDFHSLPEQTTLKQAGPLLAANTPN